MWEFPDFMRMIGSVMIALGGIGLAIIGIVTAFVVSLPLGFAAIMLTGLIVGMIGSWLAE